MSKLLDSADAYNHDVPTEAVVRRSIGRLRAAGLMAVEGVQVCLTGEGRAMAKRAGGGMFERAPVLLRLFQSWPKSDGRWDELPPGAWQAAYYEYRARLEY